MKHISAIVMTAVLVASGSAYAEGCKMASKSTTNEVAAATVKTQTQCPVMGGAVNKSIFVDAEGKRIYLCCKGCVDAVTKDPKKYIAQIEADGVTLDKTPVAAPAEKPAAK